MTENENKVNIITLGCSKNTVDSERIAAALTASGWQVAFDSDAAEGGTVVINTCGFIGDAKQESIDMILRCAQAKAEGLIERLYVIGCLSQRYGQELTAEIPEVDRFFGVRDLGEAVRELGAVWPEQYSPAREISTPSHYAYLKISEGCDRKCAYCAIPLIRGRHISTPIEKLVEETQALAARGVRELIVIAQDTTYYGIDIYGKRALPELLTALCAVEGIEWIRLHYAYPAGFPQDVIEVMRQQPKICKYLDIPLQHISDSQLRSMRRGLGMEGTKQLIEKLRQEIPALALRTTMLVGYPGETEENFTQLLEFVRQTRFERLGVFPYSAEEGTYSADKLNDDVPEQVKQQRVDRLMELQAEVSLENNTKRIGSTERIIIDRREGDYYVGRSQYDSPEVDQEVFVEAQSLAGDLDPGTFIDVRITSASHYDLNAEPV